MGNQKGKSRGGSPSGGAAPKGKGKGKGKEKGKGKGKQNSDSSSSSDSEWSARKQIPDGALRNKDLAEDEVCCINHLWRICVTPERRFKHKEFLSKDGRIAKHVRFLALAEQWGQPTGKKPDGWKPKPKSAMPAVI